MPGPFSVLFPNPSHCQDLGVRDQEVGYITNAGKQGVDFHAADEYRLRPEEQVAGLLPGQASVVDAAATDPGQEKRYHEFLRSFYKRAFGQVGRWKRLK